MNRRRFNAALAGLAAAAGLRASAPVEPRFYRIERFRSGRPPIPARVPAMVLTAEVAPYLPETLVIAGPLRLAPEGAIFLEAAEEPFTRWDGVFELRTYRTNSPAFARSLHALLPSAGIEPVLRGHSTYLIRFESLTAREKAWNALHATRAWKHLRDQIGSYRFSLYRAAYRAA
jgi:hypothetical protein